MRERDQAQDKRQYGADDGRRRVVARKGKRTFRPSLERTLCLRWRSGREQRLSLGRDTDGLALAERTHAERERRAGLYEADQEHVDPRAFQRR